MKNCKSLVLFSACYKELICVCECDCVCVLVPIFRVDSHSTRPADNISVIPLSELPIKQFLLVAPIQLHHVN